MRWWTSRSGAGPPATPGDGPKLTLPGASGTLRKNSQAPPGTAAGRRPSCEGAPQVDRRDRPPPWQSGFGDGLSQAIDMIGPPVILGLLGWFLDGRLGTSPAFLVGLAVLGVAGVFVRTFYEFQARAARHDEGKPWARRRP